MKKGSPMKTTEGLITRDYVMQQAGKMQMAHLFNKLSQVQIAQIIADLHEGQKYKEAGYGTFEELCDAFGISRQTGYRLKENLEAAGPELMGLMMQAGISIRDQRALLASGEIEDAEFEIIDPVTGAVKIGGKVLLVKDSPDLVAAELLRLQQNQQIARRALRDTEKELEEKSEEIKMLREKVFNGENKYTRLQADAKRRQQGVLEESKGEFGNLVMNLLALVNTMEKTELTEEEQKLAERYLDLIECNALQRVYDKLKVYLPKKEWED